ncbi:hypothetical protein [Butyrivibrio sp. AE2032]|uniref:hypothetical protein n=1 Tax=Butyrivibrio sp. AE2032 TaxID=1458463 RepID=UPI00163ACBD2|nr:hypothetical protein [Butyrivibrio sp. AE2032]
MNLVFSTSGAIAQYDTLFTLPSALFSSRNSSYRVLATTDFGKGVAVNPITGVVSLSEATTAAIANARICCTYII